MTNLSDVTNKVILCLDNDPDTCQVLASMFEIKRYAAVSANTVAEGLRLAEQGGFDLILLGWRFKDSTGLELCRQIRRFDEQTPILFSTGEAHVADMKEAMPAGAQGYLIKPARGEKRQSARSTPSSITAIP